MKSAPSSSCRPQALYYGKIRVRRMMNDGVDTFVEVGPGKVLCGFIKKVDRSYAPLNVEDMESLEKSLAYLKEVR